MITEPGFYPNITAREYFDEPCPAPALTNSGIKTLLGKTPADFAYEHPAITPDSPIASANAAKRFGDVAHQLALGKGRGYAVGDFDSWRTKESKLFREEAEANGQTPILAEAFENAQASAAIMKARIKATLTWIGASSGLIEPEGGWPYETEVVYAWIEETADGPIWMRCMADVWCEPLWTILDPKFSKVLHGDGIKRQIVTMGWDTQAALYARGIERLILASAGRVTFANVMVSPDPPFSARTVKIEEAWHYSAQLEIERAIKLFAGYLRLGIWPDYPIGVETLAAPEWLISRRMDATAFDQNPFDDEESEE